jgi:hypothetical protein
MNQQEKIFSLQKLLNGKVLFNPTIQELRNPESIGQWILCFNLTSKGQVIGSYHNILGRNCMISIQNLPSCFNRGEWHACLEIFDEEIIRIDANDGWLSGRYYFSLLRASQEIECWMKAWDQI